MRYGIGYKGSKSRIAKEIIEILPSGDRFINLFGGGGAMSHCAALSGKYNKVIYSDTNESIVELVEDIFSGDFTNKYDIFEWISKDCFNSRKEQNPFIKWMWSFGNNGIDYMYSKDIIDIKKSIHKAIINKIYDDMFLFITKGVVPFKSDSLFERRHEWVHYCNNLKLTNKISQIQNLERAERAVLYMNNKTILKNINCFVRNYSEYIYMDGDVVYCDPPYCGKRQDAYKGFNSDEFWEWARQTPCYISEYSAPDDFECIWKKDVKCLSRNDGNSYSATEKLFKSPACDSIMRHPKQLSLF